MNRILLALFFVSFMGQEASANRYFQRVPLSEAHLIFGRTIGETISPASIKVLVWNIKKASEEAWPQEFSAYGKERDIFVIQEAYPSPVFNLTLASLGEYQWDMGISFRYVLYDLLPTGTMIGSKALRDEFLVTHSPDLEPVTETPKAVTYSRYHVGDKNLLVANIHIVNFNKHEAFVRHMQQIEGEIKRHDGPVLIAGDFNTRTKDRIKYMLDMMTKLNLTEVKFKNGHQRMRAKFTNNILDYAFVRGLNVHEAEVIGHAQGSDHKPMLMEVSLK